MRCAERDFSRLLRFGRVVGSGGEGKERQILVAGVCGR